MVSLCNEMTLNVFHDHFKSLGMLLRRGEEAIQHLVIVLPMSTLNALDWFIVLKEKCPVQVIDLLLCRIQNQFVCHTLTMYDQDTA